MLALSSLVRGSRGGLLVLSVVALVAGCGVRSGLRDFTADGSVPPPPPVDGGRIDLGRDFGPPPPPFDGGVFCNSDFDCEDGVFCNGAETCVGGRCSPGRAPCPPDGIDCTEDSCQEATRQCQYDPRNDRCPPGQLCRPAGGGCAVVRCQSDRECTDRVACNGIEVCRGGVCAPGPGFPCGVGDPCSQAFCVELGNDMAACQLERVDRDRDGFPPDSCGGGDCNDADPRVSPGAPEACNDGRDNDCNGLADCQDPACNGVPPCPGTCSSERDPMSCFDGRDNDCDGQFDCGDFDCQPFCMPMCEPIERCGDGLDNDCNGVADCDDPFCGMQPECRPTEPCPDGDLGSRVGQRVTTGSTSGLQNRTDGSCNCGGGGGERAFQWRAPSTGNFTFDTRGSSYDAAIYVRAQGADGSCFGPELACNDDAPGGPNTTASVSLTLTAGTPVIIFVDGCGAATGQFVLNITARVVGVDAGVDGGIVDGGTPDLGACIPSARREGGAQCFNARDDDCDGRADCSDPDCVTVCRDAGPPPLDAGGCAPTAQRELGVAACTNGRDDDCDGRRDCDDFDCTPLGTGSECCNGRDDNNDGTVDEFTCRCFDNSTCQGVGSVEQVCWATTYSVCAPRCDFLGGDAFCQSPGLPMGLRCDRMTGECVR